MINVSKLYCGLAGRSDHLRYESNDTLGPVVVYNCTQRCNLRCLHCYSASGAQLGSNELTTAQAKQMLAQLSQINCPVVLFSGGEPLLRDDIFELLAEAGKLHLRTVLSTNGTLIDPATAQCLAEVGLSYAGISIDGPEAFHDQFRRQPGSFKQALHGIENCQRAGVRTGLRFTITKYNAIYAGDVFDIAAQTGVRRICFYHLIHTGRAQDLDRQTLSRQQTRAALDAVFDRTQQAVKNALVDEVLTVDNHADGPYLLLRMQRENSMFYEKARQLLLQRGGNRVGEKIACVGWDGRVYPDQFWRNYSLGTVTERTFGQIWLNTNNPVLNTIRDKSAHADPRCLRCRWFDLCKGNYRFMGSETADRYWLNEPPCYLDDEEIKM